MREYKQ